MSGGCFGPCWRWLLARCLLCLISVASAGRRASSQVVLVWCCIREVGVSPTVSQVATPLTVWPFTSSGPEETWRNIPWLGPCLPFRPGNFCFMYFDTMLLVESKFRILYSLVIFVALAGLDCHVFLWWHGWSFVTYILPVGTCSASCWYGMCLPFFYFQPLRMRLCVFASGQGIAGCHSYPIRQSLPFSYIVWFVTLSVIIDMNGLGMSF